MLNITTGQIEAWVALYLWPFLRIGACVMVAPVFGAAFVPARMRIVLAAAITLLVAPLLPPQPLVTPLSAAGLIVTVQQLIIGVAIGFVLQVVFDSLAMGGQLLANSMGLSFAFNVDPLRGASTPVLGQLYMLLVTLTFLALNGHLTVLEILVDGFRTLPVGQDGLGADGLWQIGLWGGQIFRGSLIVALPGLTALLIVNLAFGVVSRAAPTLNLFAIGFPVTLVCGLVIVLLGLPAVQTSFIGLMRESFMLLADLMRMRG
ncbi:MAG: flagellar biosynthetic protein FliR [Pseudomonadota bacterium]